MAMASRANERWLFFFSSNLISSNTSQGVRPQQLKAHFRGGSTRSLFLRFGKMGLAAQHGACSLISVVVWLVISSPNLIACLY
jgi:hypothetical protein